jgi:oligopeptidase B
MEPPRAARRLVTTTRHGHTREDAYAWLKDPNWQTVMRDPDVLDPEIRAHLEAENAHTVHVMAGTEALQEALFAEMKGRIKEDDASVPSPDGPWAYYSRYETGRQHPVFCRRPRGGGSEQVLLDGNREAEGYTFFRVGACRHSPDQRLLGYSLDLNGSEYHDLHVRDLESGETVGAPVPDAQGEIVWAGDSRALVYVRLDANHRPSHVFRHCLGADPATDALVYEEVDPAFYLSVGKTESGRLVTMTAADHATKEVRVLDADDPGCAPILVAAREDGHEYEVSEHEGRLLILTNADGAEDFKIVEAPLARPGRANWRDLVAHEEGCLIRAMLVVRDYLVRLERRDGLPRIIIRRFADGEEHAIQFDEQAYELGLVPGHEFDTVSLHFTYSSPTTPRRTFDYDMRSRERVLRKTQEVPSGHDPAAYVARRLMAPSHDGELVPITVLHRKEGPLDGSAPLLLYGYGSYGISMPASFATDRLSLVDRGFVYAIAHVRGGRERGDRWYKVGKLAHKANTFRDFVAAAEHLIAEGFGSKGGIAINGRSAGGLLVGAATNMAPDLFRAVVAEVPFVDALNTICDDTLPLTPPEWTEWGNPILDEDAYRAMLSYSPYDNVAARAYPHILATAGLTDPRVTYWEPAKWVAKLRALKTDDHMLLSRTYMAGGHAGASGRFDRLEEIAFTYAFVLKAFGMAG